MTAAKPIVATNVGNLPKMINRGNGFSVENGDFKASTNNIVKLLDDKELRQEMGQNGRKRAREFN